MYNDNGLLSALLFYTSKKSKEGKFANLLLDLGEDKMIDLVSVVCPNEYIYNKDNTKIRETKCEGLIVEAFA